jgi:hypothetical protein
MNCRKVALPAVSILLFTLASGTQPLLLGQTPGTSIESQLRTQYRPSSVGGNGVVVRAGTVLLIQQDGVKANPASCQGYWPNSYKKGSRVKQPAILIGGGCFQNVLDQVRFLQVGEKAYLTAIEIKASDIVFDVQTIPADANDVPYRAAVTFKFQKGSLDSTNVQEIRETIGGVFGIDANSTTEGASALPSDRREEPKPGQGSQQTSLFGLYVSVNPQEVGEQLQLNPDGSFSVQSVHGANSGRFTVNGDTLSLTFYAPRHVSTYNIRGDTIFYGDRPAFARSGATSEPPEPSVAPLKLPSTCVSALAQADRLQMNGDHTFSLQEAGQSYGGSFAQNGRTLELTIADTNTKTTATIQGNRLTDSSGQTWVCGQQSEGAAPAGTLLKNEDIIKMAKAGFDDSIIIAKIGSSKCQFDTSTDALIRLKQSGVSAAVMRAIAGK